MKVKQLDEGAYQIVAVMAEDDCPVESFLALGPADTRAARLGLVTMIRELAQRGFEGVPAKWLHEANKTEHIFELIKGPLRLFFFKGDGKQIAVCTSGGRKKGAKADSGAVANAAKWRRNYFEAVKANSLETVADEED